MTGNAGAQGLITPQAADAAIDDQLPGLPVEARPVSQCVGSTLRENVYAERDYPPFDRVCMDGGAIASEASKRGLRRYAVQATQAAGVPPLTLEHAESAIEVMTG